MNVLLYLVPLALMLGLTGLIAFLWTLKSGQYDDLDGAALRILPDDDIGRTNEGPMSAAAAGAPARRSPAHSPQAARPTHC